MQPLQLTAIERVGLTEQIQEELDSIDSSSTVVTFENHDSLSLVLEHNSTDSSLVLSFKVESMIEKVQPNFIGCPRQLDELDSPSVRSLCEEVNTLLQSEFDITASVEEASYTFYEWETDTGWYIYEMEF